MNFDWQKAKEYQDIIYEKMDGIAKVTINRPEVRNAFRPETIIEMYDAFVNAREDQNIGVVLLTGYGPAKDGKYAFCSGGDQRIRGDKGMLGKMVFRVLMFSIFKNLLEACPKLL